MTQCKKLRKNGLTFGKRYKRSQQQNTLSVVDLFSFWAAFTWQDNSLLLWMSFINSRPEMVSTSLGLRLSPKVWAPSCKKLAYFFAIYSYICQYFIFVNFSIGGFGNVSLALNFVHNRILSNSRTNARKIIVVVTSSGVDSHDVDAARRLKEAGKMRLVSFLSNYICRK